ncbi:MAG: hypothetical protein DMG41_06645 [Acidobacteria bacterium]|nr:MAG: hypothetical protein DMG41_06645 [Acidobacteriota bacterium]
MMDKDARQQQLLKNFLAAWQKSGSQVQAAQTAFGDLKQFGRRIEGYARQSSFMVGLVKSGEEVAEKSYTARSVSPGEIAAIRGDFFAHHNRLEQAQPVLQEAAQAEPNLAFAHEALGYYHYGSRSSAKPTQKSKRLSSWAPRVLRRSIFTESFCCNKGAWTKTLRKEPRKAWKRRFSSIRSSRPPSKASALFRSYPPPFVRSDLRTRKPRSLN